MNNIILNGIPYEMGEKPGKIFNENKIEFLEKGKKLPSQHKENREYLIYKYSEKGSQTLNAEPEFIYVPITLNKFQYQHGKESTKLLEKYFPQTSEEKKITDKLGYNYEQFAVWMMCMGCCYSLHKNNVVEVRECTSFSFTYKNRIYYGRDNDLPPSLKKVSHSLYYKTADKINLFLLFRAYGNAF